MDKILTIVIPTYNMESLLHRCLDSLIIDDNDLLDKLDVLVINDGSRDSSLQIAQEYEGKYPNVFRVINKENGNYGSCINRGLQEAKGTYFRILDADDTYTTANLSEYLRYLSIVKEDIVFSPYMVLNYDSKPAKIFDCAPELTRKCFIIDEQNWLDPELIPFRAMHAMATRTNLLRSNDYFQTEGISYTDTQFVFFSDLYASNCTIFEKPIYNYYLGRDGQTMSEASMRKSCMHFYMNAIRLLDAYSDFCKVENISFNKKVLLSRSVFAEINCSFSAVIGGFRSIALYKANIDELLQRSNQAEWEGLLSSRFTSNPYFKMYKCYHIPNILIFYFREIRNKIGSLIF